MFFHGYNQCLYVHISTCNLNCDKDISIKPVRYGVVGGGNVEKSAMKKKCVIPY